MQILDFLLEIEREHVIGIIGDLGDGKTISGVSLLLLLDILYKYCKNPKTILTNVPVSVEHEFLEYYNQLEDRKNCLIFIDEIHIVADSRQSMKKSNFFTSGITMDVRKFNNKLIWTSQESSQVEKRVRNRTKIFMHPLQTSPLIFDIALKNIVDMGIGSIRLNLNAFKTMYDTHFKPSPLIEKD